MSFTGIAFAPTPGDCTDGSCCVCQKYISVWFCCPRLNCPDYTVLEPGGPFPVFFVVNVILADGACAVINGDGTITITKAGTVSVTETETSLNYSYTLGVTTYTNDGTSKSVSIGDVLSEFTAHDTFCDIDCNQTVMNYGLWDGTPPSEHICYGATWTGTFPTIVQTVDCTTQVDCDTGLPLSVAPGLHRRAFNFVLAMLKHIAEGGTHRHKAEIDRIHAICTGTKTTAKCGYYEPNKKVCMHGKCGCNISEKDTILNKLALKSEKCPSDKW